MKSTKNNYFENTQQINQISHGKKNPQYQQIVQQQSQIQYHDVHYHSNIDYQPDHWLQIMFIYLYFIQGIILSISSTMPFVYPQIPDYNILTLFNSVLLPYSFKFIIAPFVQKYSYYKYGKRKIWLLGCQILSALCLYISSYYTEIHNSHLFAWLLILSNLFLCCQDISMDSLIRKQLKKECLISSLSTISQIIGLIIGSTLLLKLTSQQFSKNWFQKNQSITKPYIIIKVISIIVFIPSLIIHFNFKQTTLKFQHQSNNLSIYQIFKSYKAFLNFKSKYFRTILHMMINIQGFNFYRAGYEFQLVKAGFSRNINNNIQNTVIIPVSIVTCLLSSKIKPFGLKRAVILTITGQWIIYLYLRIHFPLDPYIVFACTFVQSLLQNIRVLIGTMTIYQFPLHEYSGVFITVLSSAKKFGSSTAIHTKIIAYSNWEIMSWVGIILQFFLIFAIKYFLIDWKNQGIIDLKQLLSQKQTNQQENNQYSIKHDFQIEVQQNFIKRIKDCKIQKQ